MNNGTTLCWTNWAGGSLQGYDRATDEHIATIYHISCGWQLWLRNAYVGVFATDTQAKREAEMMK